MLLPVQVTFRNIEDHVGLDDLRSKGSREDRALLQPD